MTDLGCWQCGVEPVDTYDVRTMAGVERVIPRWPDSGDHPHALTPPTPDDLVAAGYAALNRITEA